MRVYEEQSLQGNESLHEIQNKTNPTSFTSSFRERERKERSPISKSNASSSSSSKKKLLKKRESKNYTPCDVTMYKSSRAHSPSVKPLSPFYGFRPRTFPSFVCLCDEVIC